VECSEGRDEECSGQRAKFRGMMPYSELVEKITAIEFDPNSFALREWHDPEHVE
jgi:hypothetical protein